MDELTFLFIGCKLAMTLQCRFTMPPGQFMKTDKLDLYREQPSGTSGGHSVLHVIVL